MIKFIEKDIDELIPYENNARINDKAIDIVANSILSFGFKNPCIIDKNNVLVAGHTRVEACKKLGIKKVPCIVADDLTEEQKNEYEDRYFLEANFYSNSKGNGIALQELKLNYFTDYTLMSTAYRSTGMQFLGDLKQEDLTLIPTTEEKANRDEPEGFSYYDSTDGISFDGNKIRTQLNRESTFVIKIDGRPFQIQLDGTYEWTTYERQWYTLWIWNKPINNVWMYNYLDVFADCMQAIRTNSAGFGDYYITVDLSEYFTIR